MDNLWGIGIFLTVLLLIEISNYIALRRIDSFSKPDSGPLVSILIPARNEEVEYHEVCKFSSGSKLCEILK